MTDSEMKKIVQNANRIAMEIAVNENLRITFVSEPRDKIIHYAENQAVGLYVVSNIYDHKYDLKHFCKITGGDLEHAKIQLAKMERNKNITRIISQMRDQIHIEKKLSQQTLSHQLSSTDRLSFDQLDSTEQSSSSQLSSFDQLSSSEQSSSEQLFSFDQLSRSEQSSSSQLSSSVQLSTDHFSEQTPSDINLSRVQKSAVPVTLWDNSPKGIIQSYINKLILILEKPRSSSSHIKDEKLKREIQEKWLNRHKEYILNHSLQVFWILSSQHKKRMIKNICAVSLNIVLEMNHIYLKKEIVMASGVPEKNINTIWEQTDKKVIDNIRMRQPKTKR
jgi:hypothetical protein